MASTKYTQIGIENKLDELDKKLSDKFDRVEARLDSMDKTLVKQEGNLAEHMRRTELAESAITNLDNDLKPIKKHVAMLQGVLKFIALMATIVGIVAGILKIVAGV